MTQQECDIALQVLWDSVQRTIRQERGPMAQQAIDELHGMAQAEEARLRASVAVLAETESK